MVKLSLSNKELLIFDLDGVIYKGSKIIDNVLNSIEKFYKLKKKIAFFTNNSTLTTEDYKQKLSEMRICCTEEQFYTSATISAGFLAETYRDKCSCFVIGEKGLISTLEKKGISVLNRKLENKVIIKDNSVHCDFVIAGMDRNFTYEKLASATQLIDRGAKFYATNNDPSFPSEYGNLPGAGTMINSVTTVTGKQPEKIFGKPSPEGIKQILSDYRIPADKAVMFGDRPETDILSAKNAGIDSALVLTGIITKEKVREMLQKYQPDIILNDISEFQ
ncbi:MAG: HAD-IIA family hydrolase [Victivallales bacterium]|nr:HAD-IIA family hydrolase [Victivallales bacterium]MCF7889284.1 HAD-IIA family hydrolase [Victivallales bacterium]